MKARRLIITAIVAGFMLVGLSAWALGSQCDQCDQCPNKSAPGKTEGQKADKPASTAPMAFDKAPAVGTKATCPVTKEEFTVTKDTPRSEYKGKHYVFCCAGCKKPFDTDPEKYLK
jgi:YHS domain-containing protein